MNILNYLLSIITITFSLFVYDGFYSKVAYQKFRITIEKVLIYLLTAILAIILESTGIFIIKQLANVFMYFLPLIFYKKQSLYDKIYSCFIMYLFLNIIDQFINGILTFILNTDLNFKINIVESIYFYIVMTYLIMGTLVILYSNKKIIRYINYLRILINKNKKILILFLLWAISSYLLIIYDLFYEINYIIKLNIFFIIILNTIIFLLLLLYYSKYRKYKDYTNNLIYNMEGNKSNYNKYKIDKHNLNNFLLSLKDNNNLELNNRIDGYLNNASNITTNNIYDIPYNISGFLTNKINQYKCKFFINGVENLKNIEETNPRLYNEICTAIGITIDNAYDAIKNIKTKEIIIDVTKKNNKIIITICNTFNNDININEIGNLFYTTKKDGNGIGLFSILKSKYIKYNISIINNTFRISLII